MRADQLQKAARDMGISFSSAVIMRCRYLVSVISDNENYIYGKSDDIPAMTIPAALTEIISIKRHEYRYKRGITRKDGITDEMIQRARDYPITELIEFKRGTALAFCHDDHSPSLRLWKSGNKATCYPCAKSFNPIDILMERDGLSFIDAVKCLQ